NGAGATGSASLAFTLDTHAPVPTITGGVLANGQATVTGTTGEGNDRISLYDGSTLVGSATTASDGSWTITAAADPAVAHSFAANATDLAGNVGHSASPYAVGAASTTTPVTTPPVTTPPATP